MGVPGNGAVDGFCNAYCKGRNILPVPLGFRFFAKGAVLDRGEAACGCGGIQAIICGFFRLLTFLEILWSSFV